MHQDELLSDLEELLNSKADKAAGRTGLAERKDWVLAAVRERLNNSRPDFSDVPDDTLEHSER